MDFQIAFIIQFLGITWKSNYSNFILILLYRKKASQIKSISALRLKKTSSGLFSCASMPDIKKSNFTSSKDAQGSINNLHDFENPHFYSSKEGILKMKNMNQSSNILLKNNYGGSYI